MVAGAGVQKRTGVTRANKTPARGGDNAAPLRRDITPDAVTPAASAPAPALAPDPATPARRHKPHKPHKRKCPTCGEKFSPTRHGQKFCSENCRKADWRRKAKKRRKPAPPAPKPLEIGTCRHCGAAFWHEAGRVQLYCKASHRVAASVAKRAAGERALIALMGFSAIKAVECTESWGSKRLDAFLRAAGLRYDEAARVWVAPVALVTSGGN